MNAGAIIYARLAASSGVTAIVGTRILPMEVTQEIDLPALAYSVQLADAGEGTAPIQRATVTLYCMAHTEAGAHDLAVAVNGALDEYAAVNGATWLAPLQRAGWDYLRSHELNLWQVTVTYQTWVVY
jgi:hypothetical protein